MHRSFFVLLFILLAPLGAARTTLAAQGAPCPLVYSLKGKVMVFDNQTGLSRQLGQGRQPSLSPNGAQVVWVEGGEDAKAARLVLHDLASGKTTVLAQPGGYLNSPRFSPDARTIAYARLGEKGQKELWLVRAGAAPSLLARAQGANGNDFFEPSWSPDGGRVCYQDMGHFYQMTLDGKVVSKQDLASFGAGPASMFTSSDRLVIRPGTEATLTLSISVPGSKLFQQKVPDLSSAIYLFDPGTRKSTRLTNENMTAMAPAWTPDGRQIVFYGYTDTQAGAAYPFRLYVLTPGEAPRELAPGEDPMPPTAQGAKDKE